VAGARRGAPSALGEARLRPRLGALAEAGTLVDPSVAAEALPESPYGAIEPPAYAGRLEDRFWLWKGYHVRYQFRPAAGGASSKGVALCIHGFGGNAEHWRKNSADMAEAGFDVYAVDLLGYGFSSKPDPRITAPLRIDPSMPERFYNILMWAEQMGSFLKEVAGIQPSEGGEAGAVVITNSVGSSVGLQLAIDFPEYVKAATILNPSLRMLHVDNQMPWEKPFVPAVQWVLRETDLGDIFFGGVATPNTVQNILKVIYPYNPDAVDDELVDCILKPGLSSPNATRVFMDFISYSAGPLIQDQLAQLGPENGRAPVWIGWGTQDPWEPEPQGKKLYSGLPAVKRFQSLQGLGHCPMDEAPAVVNPFLVEFLEAHSWA